MNEIEKAFKNNIIQKKIIIPGDSLLLSMSAGKDSMFMFSLISGLMDEMNLRVGVFHLNHMLRGEESDGDESFLRDYLQKYNVTLHLNRYDFPNIKDSRFSFEEQAREVRYSMLKDIKNESGYDKILTAHNRDDNAETVFMRVLKGTGLRGLEGIPERENYLLRPVIHYGTEEIYDFLRKTSVPWREDSSNRSDYYLRNIVRNRIFPMLKESFPAHVNNLIKLSCHARENRELMEDLIGRNYDKYVEEHGGNHVLYAAEFHDNEPLMKFIISEILRNNYRTVLTNSVYEEIFRKFYGNRSNVSLYCNGEIEIMKGLFSGKIAIFIGAYAEDTAPEEWEYSLPECENGEVFLKETGAILSYRRISRIEYDNLKINESIVIDTGEESSVISVRNRRKGDRILIKKGSKKIKDLMIEKKLDSVAKKKVPLIIVNNEVAAYLPLPDSGDSCRISHKYCVVDDSKKIILFEYK